MGRKRRPYKPEVPTQILTQWLAQMKEGPQNAFTPILISQLEADIEKQMLKGQQEERRMKRNKKHFKHFNRSVSPTPAHFVWCGDSSPAPSLEAEDHSSSSAPNTERQFVFPSGVDGEYAKEPGSLAEELITEQQDLMASLKRSLKANITRYESSPSLETAKVLWKEIQRVDLEIWGSIDDPIKYGYDITSYTTLEDEFMKMLESIKPAGRNVQPTIHVPTVQLPATAPSPEGHFVFPSGKWDLPPEPSPAFSPKGRFVWSGESPAPTSEFKFEFSVPSPTLSPEERFSFPGELSPSPSPEERFVRSGESSVAPSPEAGVQPLPPESSHQSQHGGIPPSYRLGHVSSSAPQPSQHQELIDEVSDESSSDDAHSDDGPPDPKSSQQVMQPTPSPTGSSDVRSMSSALERKRQASRTTSKQSKSPIQQLSDQSSDPTQSTQQKQKCQQNSALGAINSLQQQVGDIPQQGNQHAVSSMPTLSPQRGGKGPTITPPDSGKDPPLKLPRGGKDPPTTPPQSGKDPPLSPNGGEDLPTTPPKGGEDPPSTPTKGGEDPPQAPAKGEKHSPITPPESGKDPPPLPPEGGKDSSTTPLKSGKDQPLTPPKGGKDPPTTPPRSGKDPAPPPQQSGGEPTSRSQQCSRNSLLNHIDSNQHVQDTLNLNWAPPFDGYPARPPQGHSNRTGMQPGMPMRSAHQIALPHHISPKHQHQAPLAGNAGEQYTISSSCKNYPYGQGLLTPRTTSLVATCHPGVHFSAGDCGTNLSSTNTPTNPLVFIIHGRPPESIRSSASNKKSKFYKWMTVLSFWVVG